MLDYSKIISENSVKRSPAMADATYQKIQLVGTSSKSLSDAISVAVAKAAELVKEPRWFEVIEQRGAISDGQVSQFQVTVMVGGRAE
jgi:dodecin